MENGKRSHLTEAQEQKSVMDWSMQPAIRSRYPELKLLYHIPNGGKRDVIEAKHLKQQGVKRGVPDLFLPVSRNGYHGLYLEMKTLSGVASQDQRWWKAELEAQGYRVEICHGWQAAVREIEGYLGEEELT